MVIAKKIAVRLGVFTLILVCMNYVYVSYFYEQDILEHAPILNELRDLPKQTKILYFGESSNTTYAESDIDKRTISEFLGDHFPKRNLASINKDASHSGIYKHLIRKVPADVNPEILIITLNLRSFNAQWKYSALETALQKSLTLLKEYPPLINRALLSFKGFEIKSEKQLDEEIQDSWKKNTLTFPKKTPYQNTKEWDDHMYEVGITDSLGNRNWEATELACHYVKAYSFQIDLETDQRIKDFEEIIDYGASRGWKVVFNLLAENTDKALELVGDDLLFLMEQNRQLLIDHFEQKGAIVVDNLSSVRNQCFIDQNWTTEHYNEIGRKKIAANIANVIENKILNQTP